MTDRLQIEVMTEGRLGPAEREAWLAWRAADPACASPYFHPDYAEAALAVAPQGGIALIHRAGQLEGFLPFQKRGGLLQPLGAPLTDYHGPILRPGLELDLTTLSRLLGAEVVSFTGLERPLRGTILHHARVARLERGFEAYMAERRAIHAGFFQSRRRQEKALIRDHGPIEFSHGPAGPGVLDWIIDNKRRQYRRTGQHDIFACGWTACLLHRLAEHEGEDFGARFSVLRVDGRIASAAMSLQAGAAAHLWFPAYNSDFAKFGPGMLATIRMLEAAAAEGCSSFDFGPGEEPYKAYFCEPGRPVGEGRLVAMPWRSSLTRALAESYAFGVGAKLGRRLHVVSACETSLGGWGRGLAAAAAATAAKAARIPAPRAVMGLAAVPALAADMAELAPLL